MSNFMFFSFIFFTLSLFFCIVLKMLKYFSKLEIPFTPPLLWEWQLKQRTQTTVKPITIFIYIVYMWTTAFHLPTCTKDSTILLFNIIHTTSYCYYLNNITLTIMWIFTYFLVTFLLYLLLLLLLIHSYFV